MKLRTKISLAATLSLLIFSQAVSIFVLWNVKETNIGEIQSAQKELLSVQIEEAKNHLEDAGRTMQRIRPEAAAAVLKEALDGWTIVWNGERQLKNSTRYEVSPEWFLEELEGQSEKAAWTGKEPLAVREAAAAGEHLLLLAAPFTFQSEEYLVLRVHEVTRQYEQIYGLFAKGFAVSLLLCAAMMAALQAVLGRILKPFYYLKETANIIACGDYSRRLRIRSRDEIGEVSESFNRMAERVEEHIRKLTMLNEQQTQMIGNMAHELKTPMTAISGYSETLLTVKLSPERREQALNYIRSECLRLSRLSAKLLELTGLYHADGEPAKTRFPAKQLLETLQMTLRERLAEKELRLECESAPDGLFVEGDWDLLVSMLTNLLDNACKASREGGRIFLSVTPEGFSVRDEGEGIAKEDLPHVTEAFYMADKSRARRQGGAGLGLSLCAQIAKLHGAALAIESAPGRGTTVRIRYEEEERERLQSGYNGKQTWIQEKR